MAAEFPALPSAAAPAPDLPGQATGLVVALEANFCRVGLEQPGPGGVDQLLCVRRTRLAKTGQQICVGDRVRVEGIDWAAARGAVAALGPRSSLLERPAVANCSRVVVVMALAQPEPDPLQLTRFLLTAERSGVAVELVLTKADLLPTDQAEQWRARLSGWGYPPLLVSSLRGEGLAPLRQRLQMPGIAVLCGPSGVGKSSLLNALIPDLALRYGPSFKAFEAVSLVVFTLEYGVRLWSAPEHARYRGLTPARARLAYATSLPAVIDLLATLPLAFAMLGLSDLRALLLLRLLRFFKLGRYSPGMASLAAALHAERKALFACFVVLIGVMLMAATMLKDIWKPGEKS
jgi:hypothetical protein